MEWFQAAEQLETLGLNLEFDIWRAVESGSLFYRLLLCENIIKF